MLKKILFIFLFFLPLRVNTEVLFGNEYVSPETYAVNEADFRKYSYNPPSSELFSDELNMPQKTKKAKKVKSQEEYQRGLVYKTAKWWVNKRYKREEPHHGTKHEIKIKARMEYEKRVTEQKQEIAD